MNEPKALSKPRLPSFLPNPPRILIAALDGWTKTRADASDAEKSAVLEALATTLKENPDRTSLRIESIPVLVRNAACDGAAPVRPCPGPSIEALFM